MRYCVFVVLLLAGCSGIEQRQVYMEHPTKTSHADFNNDWSQCAVHQPFIYRFTDWPVHSFRVAQCMESRGWRLSDRDQKSEVF